MANKKITDMGLLTAPVSSDKMEVVDVSDTSDSVDGSSRQVTLGNIITKAHGLSDSTAVGVASGVLTSGTDVAVADGGTGASDAPTARTNLGLAIGSDVQAYNARLADLAGITYAQGDILYYNGSNLVKLSPGTGGHFLKTNGAGANPQWAASSGQTTVTRIVASSGGDHTTLGAAVTAASAGDTIYIRNGTYTETTITTSTAGLNIVGESRKGVIIDLGTTTATFSGADVTFNNLRVIMSTGSLVASGANASITDVDIVTSGNSQCLSVTGNGSRVNNLYYSDGSTSYGSPKINFANTYGSITNCHFSQKLQTGSVSSGGISLNASYITMSGCTFVQTASSTNSFHLSLNTTNAKHCAVVGNTFVCASANFDGAISAYGQYHTIIGNTFKDAYYSVYTGDPHLTIVANTILASQAGIGIAIGAADTTVTGNTVYNSAGTGKGISNEGAFDDVVISGNRVKTWATGINIGNSGANRNVVVGNHVTDCTAPIADSAPDTYIRGNIGVSPLFEKEYVLMKNTSGTTIAAGAIVTFKAVAAGDEVTTTVTASDSLMYGVAGASINNNAYGYVQLLGKTTLLKVDGTTDIAVGDYITTFTTAGIGQKATAGQTAIAIALEAYTGNDSNGVIDALIIRPKTV